MPRRSERAKYIRNLRMVVTNRIHRRLMRRMVGEDDAMQDTLDLILMQRLKKLESRRYLNRKQYRNRPLDIFEMHQVRNRDPDSNNPLTEREF